MLRHERYIYNICFRMVGHAEEAEDLTQESFVKLFENLRQYKPEHQLSGWLVTIALNLCRNLLRRKKLLSFISLESWFSDGKEPVDPHCSPAESASRSQSLDTIGRHMKRLTIRQRSLMVLKYSGRFSDEEIARITGISLNNLRVQLHKAKQRIVKLVQAARMKD